jgi:DNA recombination protein RmuC
MDLLVIGFLVGAALVGAMAWVLATARASARGAAAGARAEALAREAEKAERRAAALEAELRAVEAGRAAEAGRAEVLAASLEEQRAAAIAAEAQLRDTFQAVAAETLRASQEDFLTLAAERLGAARKETSAELEARQAAQSKAIEGMVAPVRASLEKVDEQIRAMERERGTAYGALRQQMQAVAETQDKLRDATGSLVSALKAPSVRGRWGEIQLRRVVELAGMLEHCDFEEQVTAATEDARMRPDLVVRMPGGRNIVVDAKVPLGAYLEAREAEDEATRAAKLRQHAAQVQSHVAKLAAKSYWEGFASTPELVVMFIPGESLYSVALEQMPRLIEEGFAQGVLVATPTTLLGLLRTLSCGWREERLARNAQRISDEGRKLHERIATVFEHFADLGRSLGQSVRHFNATAASLNQRVLVSARRLDELDARGKKALGDAAEIEVRPTVVQVQESDRVQDAERERARARRLPQTSLNLALSPVNDDGG